VGRTSIGLRASERNRPRSGHCIFACLVGLILLVCHDPLRVTAQQATPTASAETAACDVSPRSTGEILTIVGTTVDATTSIAALPMGDPADAETTAAITQVLGEMAACLTAGDMLRFYALHSDEWLRRSLGAVEGMAIQTISIPTLDDGNRARYLGPWHVQILADGRVLAAVLLVVNGDLRPDPDRTRVLLFVDRDGRWLVDETIASVRVPDCALPVAVAAVVGPPPGTLFDNWASSCG
jgi:hypothetical protein